MYIIPKEFQASLKRIAELEAALDNLHDEKAFLVDEHNARVAEIAALKEQLAHANSDLALRAEDR